MSTPSRGGVFDAPSDKRLERFSESISFDQRLYAQDITASIAHAQMLAAVGLITDGECDKITTALGDIQRDIA